MSDELLRSLGREAKARARERDAWLEGPDAAELTAPPTDAERARLLSAVLPPPAPEAPRRWVWSLGFGLAAVAAVVIAFLAPPTAAPRYALELPGIGYSEVRGEAPGPRPVLRLARGVTAEVVLRPSAATSAQVEVRVVLEHGGTERPLAWSPERAETGALRFRAEVGAGLDLPTGRSRLGFAVGEAPVSWIEVEVSP
jgi:hypothetical protein